MDSSKFLQLFILATCLLACKQLGECRRNKTTKQHNGTLDKGNDSYRDGEGASRVDGGSLTSDVPPFLGTLWTRGPNGTDGKFAGTAIGLGGTNMIVHTNSFDRLVKTADPTPPFPDRHRQQNQVPLQYLFPSPNKIDILSQELPVRNLKLDYASNDLLGGSPFRAIKVAQGTAEFPNFAAPKLEHDKNEFGSDCKGYGYRRNSDDDSRSGNIRDFVSFPIRSNAKDCERGNCRLQIEGARSCGGHGDHGMPVLCGPERKLTYLIKSRDRSEPEFCHGSFEAFHVPHMINHLKRVPGVQLEG